MFLARAADQCDRVESAYCRLPKAIGQVSRAPCWQRYFKPPQARSSDLHIWRESPWDEAVKVACDEFLKDLPPHGRRLCIISPRLRIMTTGRRRPRRLQLRQPQDGDLRQTDPVAGHGNENLLFIGGRGAPLRQGNLPLRLGQGFPIHGARRCGVPSIAHHHESLLIVMVRAS